MAGFQRPALTPQSGTSVAEAEPFYTPLPMSGPYSGHAARCSASGLQRPALTPPSGTSAGCSLCCALCRLSQRSSLFTRRRLRLIRSAAKHGGVPASCADPSVRYLCRVLPLLRALSPVVEIEPVRTPPPASDPFRGQAWWGSSVLR